MEQVTTVAALLFSLSLATAQAQTAGLCTCPQDYQPVCGRDGATYPNHCAADCADVAVLHTGACPTEAAQPTASVAFNELLDQETQLISSVSQRHLQQLDNRNSSCACPQDYKPVCTTVGTRSNECIATCYYKEPVLYVGECNETGKPLPANKTSSAVAVVLSDTCFLLLFAVAAVFL